MVTTTLLTRIVKGSRTFNGDLDIEDSVILILLFHLYFVLFLICI